MVVTTSQPTLFATSRSSSVVIVTFGFFRLKGRRILRRMFLSDHVWKKVMMTFFFATRQSSRMY